MASENSVWFRNDYDLAQVNERGAKTLVEHLEIICTELGPDYLVGTMPVDERTVQPAQILHGGASCVLAESLGSIAANMVIDSQKFIAVGQSLTANHLRPGLKGTKVTGKAKAIHLGRRSQVWNIDIFNEEDKLVCQSTLTMAIVEKPKK